MIASYCKHYYLYFISMSQLSNAELDRDFVYPHDDDIQAERAEEDRTEWQREEEDRMMQERYAEEESRMREPFEVDTSFPDLA